MPFRSKETLERWVAEFGTFGHDVEGAVEVLLQDGRDGSDTGLVVVRLVHAPTDVYMQPVGPGNPRWEINFSARGRDFTLQAQELLGLAHELTVASALCTFLERKSYDHIETM